MTYDDHTSQAARSRIGTAELLCSSVKDTETPQTLGTDPKLQPAQLTRFTTYPECITCICRRAQCKCKKEEHFCDLLHIPFISYALRVHCPEDGSTPLHRLRQNQSQAFRRSAPVGWGRAAGHSGHNQAWAPKRPRLKRFQELKPALQSSKKVPQSPHPFPGCPRFGNQILAAVARTLVTKPNACVEPCALRNLKTLRICEPTSLLLPMQLTRPKRSSRLRDPLRFSIQVVHMPAATCFTGWVPNFKT